MPRTRTAASCRRTGRLVRYRPSPESREDGVRVRVDDGVFEGGEVAMFYDPMIAKLVTWAPTREAAIDAQVAALDAFEIDGIGHNVDFLSALMQHPRFRSGDITTDFIAEEYPEGFEGAPADPQLIADLAAIAGDDRDDARGARGGRSATSSTRPIAAAARPCGEDRRRGPPGAHRAVRRRHDGERRRRRSGRDLRAAGRRASGCSA